MADTIFYKMRLKKKKTAQDAFTKMQKSIKKRGPTKNWTATVTGNEMVICFGDEKSETFVIRFRNKKAKGFCKVDFPMEGELFDDDKKSEFKIFISMLHSIKRFCTYMEVTDDYEVAEEYFKNLDYKLVLRELTDTEQARLDRLYQLGFTNYEDLLLAILAEDLGMPEDFKWSDYSNNSGKLYFEFPEISRILEYYLLETAYLNKKPLYEDERYQQPRNCGDPPAEVYAFALGIGAVFRSYKFVLNRWGRGEQVSKYFTDKFIPVFIKSDRYEKCRLAYRFMMSVYDFCKFKFVGKEGAEFAPRERFDSNFDYLSDKLPTFR